MIFNAKHRIRQLFDAIRTSIWFVPASMGLGAILLAFFMLRIDHTGESIRWHWLSHLQIGAEGVRQIFIVTIGSMMTITGVTFSISVVALSLASNQFGPKILRNYLTDTTNKCVLGLLIGTFIYGLTVLVFIDGGEKGYVPLLATLMNLGLTVVAIGGMIYFIHNISTSIQAEQIIAVIGAELDGAISQTLTSDLDRSFTDEQLDEKWDRSVAMLCTWPLKSSKSGYLQTIDYVKLTELAEAGEYRLRIRERAGCFLIENGQFGEFISTQKPDAVTLNAIYEHVFFGRQRTPLQDIEFAVDQLVQVALRALSPGINDPFTAITCIDWLSASLGRMGLLEFPSSYTLDGNNTSRVKASSFSFSGAVNAVYNPMRQNARGNVMVLIRLMESLTAIALVLEDATRQQCIFRHAELIMESAEEDDLRPSDLQELQQRFDKLAGIVDK